MFKSILPVLFDAFNQGIRLQFKGEPMHLGWKRIMVNQIIIKNF